MRLPCRKNTNGESGVLQRAPTRSLRMPVGDVVIHPRAGIVELADRVPLQTLGFASQQPLGLPKLSAGRLLQPAEFHRDPPTCDLA